MSKRRLYLWAAMAALPGLLAPATLLADPTLQELSEKMAALQAEMNKLKVEQQEAVEKQQKKDVMQDAVKDADTRLTLSAGGGVNAGYKDRKFFIKSDDGNFLLHPWLHLQIRDTTNYRDTTTISSTGGTAVSRDDDDIENGFELRRARFGFDGNFISPDFTYLLNWATNRAGGTVNVIDKTNTKLGTAQSNIGGLPTLEEAWVKYRLFDSPWYIHAGQLHDPLSHENIVGSKYIAPERSIQDDLFSNVDTFVQGATIIYDPKSFIRFEGGVTDGIYSNNTSFQDSETNDFITYNYGVAGRVEYKAMGAWKDYDQFTALGDKENLLVFGLGSDFSQGSNFNQFTHAADVQFATPGGLFLYGSYIGRYIANNPGIPLGSATSGTVAGSGTVGFGKDTYEPSAYVQASFLINQKIEPFAKYEYMHLEGTPTGVNNNVHEISVGSNYYIWGHNAKFTGQVMYLPNGIPINDTSSDILSDFNHAEVVMMLQFQLLL